MSDLQGLRKAVVNSLRDVLPRDVHVATTPGRFDLRALDKRTIPVPSVLVASLDATTAPIGNALGVDATVDMVAYIVAAGDRHMTADERVLLLQSMCLPAVDLADWGYECEPATDVRGRNLHSADITDKYAIELAAVTWRQTLQLGEPAEAGESPRDVWATFEPDDFAEVETPDTEHVTGDDHE